MKKTFNINLKSILITSIIVISLFFGGVEYFNHKLNTVNNELEQTVNFNNALEDSLRFTKNQLNEVKATKLTLQLSLKKLNKENDKLNNNQKELLKRVNNLKNKNNLISAALVNTHAKIDSLKNSSDTVKVNEEDTSITFKKDSDTIMYDFTVKGVKSVNTPILNINSLTIPNKQFVTYNFEDDKQNPVSFSISNSNPLIKTKSAESYIIPEVNKKDLNNSIFNKINQFLNKPAFKIIGGTLIFSTGFYVGSQL